MNTYYKIAVWDARSFCWKDAAPGFKETFPTRADAEAFCKGKPGRYRASRVDPDGVRTDYDGFDVAGTVDAPARKPRTGPRLTSRPTPWK